jgi:NAD(P)-dependent dehydrogenase (short-subunit alcohol dehydrogenase family)
MLDVTDEMRCAEVVDQVRPWAIVNNAGYSGVGAIEDVSDDEARQQLETMVVAPMRLARLALPHMRVARDGRIVNVSSIYGLTTPDGVTGRSDQGTYVSACLCVLVTVSSLGYNS